MYPINQGILFTYILFCFVFGWDIKYGNALVYILI
jgi:hypothetical protein